MSTSAAKGLKSLALDFHDFRQALPPQVLREDMAIGADTVIGTAILDEAVALWYQWRDEAATTPDWSSFVPFKHPRLLPSVMLYRQVGQRYRCVLVGEAAAGSLPIKIAGQFIDEVMPPENLEDVSRRLDRALDTGLPNFVEKTMAWQIGYDLVSYRALQLPFRSADGSDARVMSVMDFRADAAPS